MSSAARNCTTDCEILILLKYEEAYRRTHVLLTLLLSTPLFNESKEVEDHD